MPTVQGGFPHDPNALTVWGPRLNVQVGFFGSAPPPPTQSFSALVDTGATYSMIDTQLASRLGLPVMGQTAFGGVDGPATSDQYLANLWAPDLNHRQYGAFAGAKLAEAGFDFQVLLGRSFLASFIMVYEGRNGSVVVSNDIDAIPPPFEQPAPLPT